MIKMMKKDIRRFCHKQDGSASIELVLVTPIIVWAMLSTLVYFDAFRAETRSARAGLTIADMFSRETNKPAQISSSYIDAAHDLLRTLGESDPNPGLRVTSYTYDGDDDRYVVRWSQNRNLGPNLTTAELVFIRDQLPIMADGDTSILVETRIDYTAPFSLGIAPFTNNTLGPVEFPTFTVISPRLVPAICYDPTPSDPKNGDEIC